MKKATITFITSAALTFAIPLYAGDDYGMKSDPQQKAGLTQQQSGQNITADKLQGMTIVSQKGEEIGEIKKVKIDKNSGEIQYITFSKGGIFGMGGEDVAAPLSAFEFSGEEARLAVDQSKLENVPQQTTEATDSDYQRNLETHYGVAPAWNRGDMNDSTNQTMGQDATKNQKMDQDATPNHRMDQDATKTQNEDSEY